MKKFKVILTGVLMFILLPCLANATSMSVGIKCSDVYVGETTTCTIYANVSGGTIAGIVGAISVSGPATATSFVASSGWYAMPGNGISAIELMRSESNPGGTVNIGTLSLTGNSVGTVTVKVSDCTGTDGDYADVEISNTSKSFSVKERPTSAPEETTTKSPSSNSSNNSISKKSTTTTTTTTTTIPVTEEVVPVSLDLTNLTVDGFEVTYDGDGKYYVTVDYDTESVEVLASANENVIVTGSGVKDLTEGKNVVEIVVSDSTGNTYTYQVIITRPEDTNSYSTLLSLLKVAGYNIKFEKEKYEYTMYINDDIDDIYIIAEAETEGAIITGSGLIELSDGSNDLYITVQYEDLSTTEYVIHIKRLNLMMILLYIIVFLTIGVFIHGIYIFVYKKKSKENLSNEKNKILATANRTISQVTASLGMKINGENSSVIGEKSEVTNKVISTKVEPTKLEKEKSANITSNNSLTKKTTNKNGKASVLPSVEYEDEKLNEKKDTHDSVIFADTKNDTSSKVKNNTSSKSYSNNKNIKKNRDIIQDSINFNSVETDNKKIKEKNTPSLPDIEYDINKNLKEKKITGTIQDSIDFGDDLFSVMNDDSIDLDDLQKIDEIINTDEEYDIDQECKEKEIKGVIQDSIDFGDDDPNSIKK